MTIKPLIRTFVLLLLIQTAIVFAVPGLTATAGDSILLLAICAIFAAIYLFGTHRILGGSGVSQSRFNALYFGMMGLRMLTALIFIVIYLIFSGLTKIPGTIFLICMYFVYMGFEIKFILPKLRTDSEKSKNTDDARK